MDADVRIRAPQRGMGWQGDATLGSADAAEGRSLIPDAPDATRWHGGIAPIAVLLIVLLGGWGTATAASSKKSAREAPPASQPLPSPEEILEKIEKARTGRDTLRGEFSQKKRVSLFREELRSSGKFAFKRPAKLRWEYVAPDPSLVIIDGTVLITRMPGSRPETRDLSRETTLKAFLGPLLAALGATPLREAIRDFGVSVVGPTTLRFIPKGDGAKYLHFFELRFDGSWQVSGVRISEKNGDETDIVFRNLKLNTKIDEGDFRP